MYKLLLSKGMCCWLWPLSLCSPTRTLFPFLAQRILHVPSVVLTMAKALGWCWCAIRVWTWRTAFPVDRQPETVSLCIHKSFWIPVEPVCVTLTNQANDLFISMTSHWGERHVLHSMGMLVVLCLSDSSWCRHFVIERAHVKLHSQSHRIMKWLGLDGTLKVIRFHPPAITSLNRSGCSEPTLTWPCTLPGVDHLWRFQAICSSASLPSR